MADDRPDLTPDPAADLSRLYEADILAWSEQQAAALRSHPVDLGLLDWNNLAEEIEDVGKSAIRACRSQVDNILTHLLKIEFLGPDEVVPHWKGEIVGFRASLADELTPTIERQVRERLGAQLSTAVSRLEVAGRLSVADAVYAKLRGYTWAQIVDDDWWPTLGQPAVV